MLTKTWKNHLSNRYCIFLLLPIVLGILVTAPHAFAATTQIVMSPGAGADQSCVAANNCFSPNEVNIAVGDTVTWTNTDSVGHTVTSGNPSDSQTGTIFYSGLIQSGGSYSITFNQAGEYPYFCEVHPWMIGDITVIQNTQSTTPPPQYTPPQETISVSTDRTSYNYGDTITISGSLYPAVSNQAVIIKIINPDGSIRSNLQTYTSSDGSFSYSIPTTGSTAVAGTYTVVVSYSNARNQISFTYGGQPQTISTPQPIVQTNNGGLRYKMIFLYSPGQCTDFQRQALAFYQSVADQYLEKYGYTPSPETWCVSKDDVTTAITYGSGYAVTIVIPDILASIPYTLNTNALGHTVLAGNSRAIVSTAYSITPESAFSAWTLSHELSHFILNYKGYPSSIYVDWVHAVQRAKDQCENMDSTLASCQNLWTTIQAPSGKPIPVMEIYQGPSPQNQTPQPSYLYPTLNVQPPAVNGLTVTVYGSTQANTYGASINAILWSWGDGQSLYGGFPQSHTYANAGTYPIKVVSCDNYKFCKWQSYTVTVQPPPPPQYTSPSQQPPSQIEGTTIQNPLGSLNVHAYSSPDNNQQWFLDVSGHISNQYYNRGNPIETIITNQEGVIVYDQSSLTTGQISGSMDISNWQDGLYYLKVKYGAYSSPNISFIKSSISNQQNQSPATSQPSQLPSPTTIPVDGTNFSVTYAITNGKVLDIKTDQPNTSLIVSIQTTGDGILTITLPRALIDTKNPDGTDKQFVVANDGQAAEFTETSTTNTDRTLTIHFKDGTQQIAIMGTFVLGSNSPLQSVPSPAPSALQPSQFTISVNQDTGFNPTTINIPVGSIVTWNNDDNAYHNIVFPNSIPGTPPSSINISLTPNTKSTSLTFPSVGTYSYYDEIHSSMNGTIIVGNNPVSPEPKQSVQQASSTPQQNPQVTGFVKTDNDRYTLPSVPGDTTSVKIRGHVDNVSSGQVKIAWTGENNPEASAIADISSSGDFSYDITLDSNSPAGKYQVTVYYGSGAQNDDPNSVVDKTSFTVNSSNQQSPENNQDKNKGKFCFLFWCW